MGEKIVISSRKIKHEDLNVACKGKRKKQTKKLKPIFFKVGKKNSFCRTGHTGDSITKRWT